LEDLGKTAWDGFFPREGVSAHPKVDEHTGELLFFSYFTEAPYLRYGVVNRAGQLTDHVDVPLPGPRLPHDMAFTENWSILNDLPLFWSPEGLADGYYSNVFDRDLPSRFALIPRHGTTEDILWFESDPTFVLHWTNAFEDGDWVVLDGFFQHNPTARGVERQTGPLKGFETLDMNVLEARAHRWKFNIRTGECREEATSETCAEFPMINARHAGRRHRYSYNARCSPGLFAFDGLIKHDLDTGTEELFEFEPGVFISETAMAPRDGSSAEDDGYLVTFASDINNDFSEALVFDASAMMEGPVCKIRLPERISSGTHSTWAPSTAL
jgi:carotenoid cleavage dioxygenase